MKLPIALLLLCLTGCASLPKSKPHVIEMKAVVTTEGVYVWTVQDGEELGIHFVLDRETILECE